jgi:membrane-bound serine protease (ClpP class)
MTEGATNVVTIAKVGEILTLTNTEAEREYGSPPKKLLSAGTAATLEELLTKLGYAGAERRDIRATGAEQVGFWLNAISPLLLMIGIIGIYIEFKTPGFGFPGIIAIAAFALYFLGGYVAGLSGLEWIAVFVVGVVLLALELFFFPGTAVLGLSGAALMLTALVMATADMYPGMPKLPGLPQLRLPIWNLSTAFVGAAVAVLVLNRLLPKTRLYRTLVSETASGVLTETEQQQQRSALLGQSGVSLSSLRPGGKAQFGNVILDVISQGDLVPKGTPVKIIGFSGTEALVEVIGQK